LNAYACFAAGLTALAVSGGAQAAVSVIGGGLARQCYTAAALDLPPRLNDIAACTTSLEKEMLSRRDKAATFTNRAVLYLRQRNGALALADLDVARRLSPAIGDVEINRAAALLLIGRPQEALAAADKGLSSGPVEPWSGHYNRAVAKEMLGDAAGAYADYQAALTLKPGWQDALDQLARFQVITAADAAQ
jgi:tetratricopeptide (TPR) repeat protein